MNRMVAGQEIHAAGSASVLRRLFGCEGGRRGLGKRVPGRFRRV